MTRPFLFCVLAAVTLSPVLGASLEDLAGAGRAAALRSTTEPITEVQTKNPSPRLLPRHEGLEAFIDGLQRGLEPGIIVESLSLYHKPSPRENAGWSRDEQTSLLNQLVALSTLAGIEYYSVSRKAMRVFYEFSQVIDNPAAKNPLPDPAYTALPNSLSLYARQKDLTFGDNIYQYDYHISDDAIFFVQENLTPMSIALGKNRFRMAIAVIDAGDALLIYAAAMAKAVSLPGVGDRIGASFTNRAKAILSWFAGRADIVF